MNRKQALETYYRLQAAHIELSNAGLEDDVECVRIFMEDWRTIYKLTNHEIKSGEVEEVIT